MYKGVHVKSKLQHSGIWTANQPLVLSPNSIILPNSHCAFIPGRKVLGHLLKMLLFFFTLKISWGLNCVSWNCVSRGLSVYWFYLNAESHRERVRNSLLQEVLRDLESEVGTGEMATNVTCTCEWESGSLKEGLPILADSVNLLEPGSLCKVIRIWRINPVIARVICFHGRYLVWLSSG